MRELFKLAGGRHATDEDVDRVRRERPDLWEAALRELASGELRKSFATPRVDFRGFGGNRGRPMSDIPLGKVSDDKSDVADADADDAAAGPALRALRARRRRREREEG